MRELRRECSLLTRFCRTPLLNPTTWDLRLSIQRAWCVILATLLLMSPLRCYATEPATPQVVENSRRLLATQCADILGVRKQLDQLLLLRESGQADSSEATALRAKILRKILVGYLDVRRSTNKLELELSYTYAILDREHRKQDDINQFLNLVNFAQFSVFYTLEPYMRIHKHFKTSAEFTCIGAGLGLFFPVVGIVHAKMAKAHHTAPPSALAPVLEGGPVDGKNLPESLEKFLDLPSPGKAVTRREEMFSAWKKRTGVDPHSAATLCSLQRNTASFAVLNKRIVLLWSLHTFVEDFDNALLSLLTLVRMTCSSSVGDGDVSQTVSGLGQPASEAARLLRVQKLAAQLIEVNRSAKPTDSKLQAQLEVEFMEAVVCGLLEMHIATDQIDSELNYAYDVVLSSLLIKRGKGLQKNFEANFIQSGVFSAIAGLLFLKQHSKAGNEMFVIESSIGTLLSSLALVQLHGGRRKIDTPPNALADVFDLDARKPHRFSPLVIAFLDSPSPRSTTGQTRKEYLLHQWKKYRISTMDIDKKKNQIKLAAADSKYRDTINIVRNRVSLLHSLRARLEEFDAGLFDLVRETGPQYEHIPAHRRSAHETTAQLAPTATGVANILGVQAQANKLAAAAQQDNPPPDLVSEQLWLTRRVLYAVLDVGRAVDAVDLEIAVEREAVDHLKRMRDLAIQMTNTANFFQINVLGLIIDGPLSLTGSARKNLYANRLNIVSGLTVGGLAGLTIIEHPGGVRLERVHPNTLAPVFNLDNNNAPVLSQEICDFLNAPTFHLSGSGATLSGETRMQKLVTYWQESKVISSKIESQSEKEKLAAVPPGHRQINERIKLISDRIRMLYDVRTMISLMDEGLSDLLRAIN